MNEVWKIVEGHPSYEVSSLGKVRTNKIRKKVLSPSKNKKGYLRVSLDGKKYTIHKLVAIHYVEGNKSLQVNHKDGNKENNVYTNLEWMTCKENIRHAFDLGLRFFVEKQRDELGRFKKNKNMI